ncbi:putative trans-sialidase [Trypanosoma cruzi]|nr:putative trans-sialidase [Trypanosoma cruzi]
MEGGTLVFTLRARNGENRSFSRITYSTDNGNTWVFPEGISPANCTDPRITEWEGSLLMIVDCENDQRVYESRDMGTTWTTAAGKLPGVWTKSKSEDYPEGVLRVEAPITANIEGVKVMLYTWKGYFSGEKKGKCVPSLGHGQQPLVFCWTGCHG